MFKQFFKDLKQEFTGYNSAKLMKDVMAGLTVCAVALPLALAFGVSSGASAASGLVTAIIAGLAPALYSTSQPTAMVLKGTLIQHLMDTDEAAQDMMETLIRQMAQAGGVTEELKRRDQMAWVQRMNSIRNRAEEIVQNEYIFC